MSQKIAAESWPKPALEKVEEPWLLVREYDEDRHKVAVEKLEKLCEVGQRGKPSLVTDLMGDPICRIRHFQLHVMLVTSYKYSKLLSSVLLFSVLHYLELEIFNIMSVWMHFLL